MADIQKLNVNSTTYDISTTWSKVTGKPSTFPPESHTHSYLPLSGGTMSNQNVVVNLNADLLDGYSGSAYAKKTDLASYLPLSGGTMTGNITLGNGNAILGSGSSIPAKFLDSAAITPEVQSVWLAAIGNNGNSGGGGEAAGILLDGNTIKMWAPLDNQPQIIDSDNGAAYTLYHSGNLTIPTTLPANGGNADTVDGYHHTSFAKTADVNNLLHSGNEFTYAAPKYSGDIWHNYRTSSWGTDGAIANYRFGNGAGGYASVFASTFYNSSGTQVSYQGHTHTKSQITDFPSSMPASDVYSWAKAASKPSYNFGEIGAGVATIGDGANRLMFRTNGSYASGMYYSTPGNEAHVFANVNAVTSWIFATTNPTSQTAWTSLTPSMQIKNGRVVINKLIANDTNASYNLDVNGSANATTLYEGGTRVSLAGHTHTKSQITDFPSSMPASDVYSWAKAASKPSYTYSEVGAAPASHSHDYLPLSGGTMSGQLFIQYAKKGLTSIVKNSSSLIIGNVPNTSGFNGYHAGIGFNALCYSPYTDHIHAWIGLGPYTTTTSAECYPLVFATNGSTTTGTSPTVKMTIAPDGKITMTNTCTAAGFYQSSDELLKTFYDPIKVDLDKLKTLRKNYFKFNDKEDKLEIGVSAQEVQEIYPELVTENDEGYLSVAYDKLSVIALKAIDELDNKYQKEIDDLNDQLSTIKNILKEKGIL